MDLGEAVFLVVPVGGLAPWEVIALLLFVGLFAFLVVACLAAFIAVTAPVGGVVCLLFRSRRGDERFRDFLLGTVRWACWFLPWLHYVLYARRGRRAPVSMVGTGYAILFLVWLLGPIAGGFVLAAMASEFYNLNDMGLGFVPYLLPLSNMAGLAWSGVMVVLEFKERSFAVVGTRQMAPFALCMAGCLVSLFCYLPIRLMG